MSFEAIVGTIIGSGITLLATYLSHNFSEKRETLQVERKRKEEAVSQIYSPLVFTLDKTGHLFSLIMATNETLKEMPESEDEQKNAIYIVNFLTAREAAVHPRALENMLMEKSGLIESRLFYADLLILHNYLSSLGSFLSVLISKSSEKPTQLRRYLLSMGPIIRILNEGISAMRKHSMIKVFGESIEYKQFFTEQKCSELDVYVDETNKEFTGHTVIDWDHLIKRLNPE